jgi:hypothetical protein
MMRISYLKKILSMYPDDMAVYIQTTPDDLCSPVETETFSLMPAWLDEKSGQLEPAKLLLTAYRPSKP